MKALLKHVTSNFKSLINEGKTLIYFHWFRNWQEIIKQPVKIFLKNHLPLLFSEKELNKKDHPEIYSSCIEYEKLIHKAYLRIKKSGFEPDHIAAISRGGLIIGLYLSHAFNKPLVVIAAESWPNGIKQKEVKFARHSVFTTKTVKGNILLADDMTESGDSFIEGQKYLKRKFPEITRIKTVAVFHKEWSKYQPNFYGRILKINPQGLIPWILQPFEISRSEK